MEVTFVRHGQSEANAGLTDNPDSALTPLGEKQAQATAARLKEEGFAPTGSCFLLTSPLLRTLMTAQAIHEATGLPGMLFSDVCEFFSERHAAKFRAFKGLSPDEIARRFPFAVPDADFARENCWWPLHLETDSTLYARALRVRDTLLARYSKPEDRVVIVSHADPIGRLIEAFLRLMPDMEGPPWTDNGSISRLRADSPAGPAHLFLLNDTSHLEALGLASPVLRPS